MSSPIIHFNDMYDNIDYGIKNSDSTIIVDAEYNWWGDSTGPYHPTLNPGGLGDTVSDYVDFIPWLYWPGVKEQPTIKPVNRHNVIGATVFAGPLILPISNKCKVFDITGRQIYTLDPAPGIYFIQVDDKTINKVIKIK